MTRFSKSEGKVQGHSETTCNFAADAYISTVCRQGLLVTVLHGMPARTSYEKGVCLSVSSSDKRMISDKKKESCANILIPHERSFILVL